jgi:hypothetical protein
VATAAPATSGAASTSATTPPESVPADE